MIGFSLCSSGSTPKQQDPTSEAEQNKKPSGLWSFSKNKLLNYVANVQSRVHQVLSSPLLEKIKGKSKSLSESSKNLLKSLKNKSKQALNTTKHLLKEQYDKLKQSKPAQKIKKLSKKAMRKLLDHLDLIPPSEKNLKEEDEESSSVSVVVH